MELIGLLLPPLIDLINRKIENTDIRFWVSILVCIVIAAVVQLVSGGGTAAEYYEAILKFIAMAQISYKAVYSESRLQTRIRG